MLLFLDKSSFCNEWDIWEKTGRAATFKSIWFMFNSYIFGHTLNKLLTNSDMFPVFLEISIFERFLSSINSNLEEIKKFLSWVCIFWSLMTSRLWHFVKTIFTNTSWYYFLSLKSRILILLYKFSSDTWFKSSLSRAEESLMHCSN